MAIRNPFEHSYRNSLPKPKLFQMGGQAPSDNSVFGRQMEQRAPPVPSNQTPEKRPPADEWDKYLSDMQDIYTKEGPAASAYRQHMESVPTYQKPSKWGRVGAALVGGAEGMRSGAAAGFQAGQEVNQAPYRRAMEEWGVKEQALGRNAEIEDKQSNRQLQFMKESRQISSDRAEAGRWMKDYDLRVKKEENDETQANAEREHWKDLGYKEYTDDKGDLWAYQPGKAGSERRVGKTSKAKELDYQGRTTKATESNAATNAGGLRLRTKIEDRMREREDRYEEPPITASEQASARSSAMSRAAAENPDWAGYVSPEGGVNPPRGSKDRTAFNAFMKRTEEIESGIFGRRRDMKPREPPPYEY